MGADSNSEGFIATRERRERKGFQCLDNGFIIFPMAGTISSNGWNNPVKDIKFFALRYLSELNFVRG